MIAKANAGYREGQEPQTCAYCEFWQRGECDLVEGDISANAVCDLWMPEEEEEEGEERLSAKSSDAVDPDERDRVYSDYKKNTNMSASELREWRDNECSKAASLSRAPIDRNIRLLSKNKDEWNARDIRDANRTISFVSRMRGVKDGQPVNERCNKSKRYYSLKNWAFDVAKGDSVQVLGRFRDDFTLTGEIRADALRAPTDEEMTKIRGYKPDGVNELTAQEVSVVTLMATNNLLTYDDKKWSMRSLEAFPSIIVGKQALIDHNDLSVEACWGKIFDAMLVRKPTAPNDVADRLPYQSEANRRIIAQEGYAELIVKVYVQNSHPIVEDIRFGRRDRVSVGGFFYEALRCDNCNCSEGWPYCERDKLIPERQYGLKPGSTIAANNRVYEVSSYAVRDGLLAAEEVSFVNSGNIPAAGIVRSAG